MQLPKTILVPTDFSPEGRDALQYARALATKLDARLYVLHAWAKPARDANSNWAMPNDYRGELESSARAQLEALVDEIPDQCEARALFYVGDPRESILKAAREINADLIVMGTHGGGKLSRVLMGSVADAVVRSAECPVTTVRHPVADDASAERRPMST